MWLKMFWTILPVMVGGLVWALFSQISGCHLQVSSCHNYLDDHLILVLRPFVIILSNNGSRIIGYYRLEFLGTLDKGFIIELTCYKEINKFILKNSHDGSANNA